MAKDRESKESELFVRLNDNYANKILVDNNIKLYLREMNRKQHRPEFEIGSLRQVATTITVDLLMPFHKWVYGSEFLSNKGNLVCSAI